MSNAGNKICFPLKKNVSYQIEKHSMFLKWLVCPAWRNMPTKQCYRLCQPSGNMARKQSFLVCPPSGKMATPMRRLSPATAFRTVLCQGLKPQARWHVHGHIHIVGENAILMTMHTNLFNLLHTSSCLAQTKDLSSEFHKHNILS
jgi:hypothetical protein